MSRVALREPMPRKKNDAPEGGEGQGKKTTMKVAPDLIRKAKMVAIHKDVDLFDYVESILRPVVERDYDRMIQDEAKRD